MKTTQRILLQNLKKRDHLGEVSVSWEIHATLHFMISECDGVPDVRVWWLFFVITVMNRAAKKARGVQRNILRSQETIASQGTLSM
jgi:hypothetical protein